MSDNQQIHLVIQGEPKAQKRHRHASRGKFIQKYDPSAADKGDFLSIVQKNAPAKPFDVPIRVVVRFYFSRPKSHYKTGKNAGVLRDNAPKFHTSRPDFDNCGKFFSDAMNKVFWRDDSVISQCSISKMYSDTPRTEIIITVL